MNYQDLKNELDKMNPEQLQQKVFVLIEDESNGKPLTEVFVTEADIYSKIDDEEVSGTLEDLEDNCLDDNFVLADYKMVTPAGTIFLYSE